jgi:outer membrane lipoprotein LolB
MKSTLRILAAAASLLLAACAPQQLVRNEGDAASLAQQQAREQQLAGVNHWVLQGRLSVSSDRDSGGPGNLTWTQNGDHYEFTLRAPIVGKSFRLIGGPDGAELDGLEGGPQHGPDAEALMQRALGWDVPLSELRAWVLGVRAKGSAAELSFGDDKLPSLLQQDGWSVSYPTWDTTHQPPLPTKVFAEKPPYKVRLAIESWSVQ